MNKEEKAQYDFKAVRETMNESHHVHKEIAIELLKSLEKRHLELLVQPLISNNEVKEAVRLLMINNVFYQSEDREYHAQVMGNVNIIKHHIFKQQEEIERKTKSISELNEMLEITVIAEMLDLIKNGNPIPPTRKELQSKLDKIEEVLENTRLQTKEGQLIYSMLKQILADDKQIAEIERKHNRGE